MSAVTPARQRRKNRVGTPATPWHYPAMNEYERIARVIRHLEASHAEQPDLASLAKVAGLSPFHFHRLFSAWAGVTPKDFLQCLTLAHAKDLLQKGASVLDAALASGLSGPGRLHDLCVTLEAATPGEVKSGGAGWTLSAGFADSPFGRCLIGAGPRGLCHLSFLDDDARRRWPRFTGTGQRRGCGATMRPRHGWPARFSHRRPNVPRAPRCARS